MELGDKIKEIRKKKKLNQQELAERSGISQTYLCQIEKGDRKPNIEILEKISSALGLPYPFLSLLAFDYSKIPTVEQEKFKKISSAINALIEDVFIRDVVKG